MYMHTSFHYNTLLCMYNTLLKLDEWEITKLHYNTLLKLDEWEITITTYLRYINLNYLDTSQLVLKVIWSKNKIK